MRGAKKKTQFLLLAVVVLTGLAVTGGIAPLQAEGASANPRIAPIQSHPHGSTYGEWAAEWWQWALQTPASVNPILDTTGELCSVAQRGHVWFLGGTFGNPPVVRACTVPSGTALFFPLINAFYGAFLNDPPETRTEEFLRAQVDCSAPSELFAEIDGVAVRNPAQYLEKSPLFDVQLPEDNVFGVGPDIAPELLLSPSADKGYYLFVRPLSPGNHTIRWGATWSCPFGDFSEDVTYLLTIGRRNR